VLYGDVQRWGLIEADTLELLPRLPDACVDAVITDPPYGIEITGAAWDGSDICRAGREDDPRRSRGEAFSHWTRRWATECRRLLKPGGYLVAFGAPRTFHRLVAGVEDAELEIRDVLLWLNGQGMPKSRRLPGGVGTALKPAYEPIVLARRPFDGRLDANQACWGTGALGIDATRDRSGRWPANVALSHASECAAVGCVPSCPAGLLDVAAPEVQPSRFFYCAKASRSEREAGCEGLATRTVPLYTGRSRAPRMVRNAHPTVKPLDLMRWLVRLACPPGGVVLDPFTGSGSTGAAAVMERCQFVGVERSPEFMQIARARLDHWAAQAKRGSA
jgi:site-specific DNA-methyltransferase (adenine-specific)